MQHLRHEAVLEDGLEGAGDGVGDEVGVGVGVGVGSGGATARVPARRVSDLPSILVYGWGLRQICRREEMHAFI